MKRLLSAMACSTCIVALATGALAQVSQSVRTYNWTLIESPGAALLWPNGLGSPGAYDADFPLLGRVMTKTVGSPPNELIGAVTDPSEANACSLPPSHPCDTDQPPGFLLPAGSAEGPSGSGGSIECNRKVIACNTSTIPLQGHGGHPSNEDAIGEYSYLVVHKEDGSNRLGFISGQYVTQQEGFGCNTCAPSGAGKDKNNVTALMNTTPTAEVAPLSVSLWTTQWLGSHGHASISLASGGAGAGAASVCGSGALFQTVDVSFCSGGTNFSMPELRVSYRTYSTDLVNHASPSYPGRCNGPDCYLKSVIIPAAMAQSNGEARNIQVASSTAVLPAAAPSGLANATVEKFMFSFTTQKLDLDLDGSEDRVDPCPNDDTDGCTQDLINSGTCPAGQVFCADANGDLGCLDSALCSSRNDITQDCVADGTDTNTLFGVQNGVQGTEVFNTGIPIGPFDP